MLFERGFILNSLGSGGTMARRNKQLAGIIFLLGVTACQPAPAPRPVPVPPPVVARPAPPPAPLPPGGAAASTVVPPFGVDGVRVTPNRGLSTEEHIWNFRIAQNVAALNCRGVTWDELGRNYNQMLVSYKNTLAKVNTAVDAQYRARHGGGGLRIRDTQTTQLYNYFALPTVRAEFCNTALQKSREVLALTPVTSDGFRSFAITGLNDLDRIFINFFDSYAQYEAALAAWQAKYGS
jgi:hypothetical protein